jgi:hypothetical protein
MLEKTRDTTNNEKPRNTGSIGHRTQNEDKLNKNTTQIIEKMSNTKPYHS